MTPEVSRRLGLILGRNWVTPGERGQIISAALGAETWDDIPEEVRSLIDELGRRRPPSGSDPDLDTIRSYPAADEEDLTDDDAPGPDEIGDEDEDFDEDELAHIHALLDEEDGEDPELNRADLAIGRERLHLYWTRGKGLAKWLGHPHPWTSLYRHLRKYVGSERAKRMAAKWHKEVLGIWPGEKKGKNPVGPG